MTKSYLIYIQFLGFRYSGWMWQPNVKTVQGMVDKTIEFMFPDSEFKTFGTGRTDARVSANKFGFQLQIDVELAVDFIDQFNTNLPSDIKALSFGPVEEDFNPLKKNGLKYYLYLFSFGEKAHPFSANMVYNQLGDLDIELMQKGTKLFEGEHDFRKYCTKPSENTQFIRTISTCEINQTLPYRANFFPENLWAFHIKSEGFMRYQIRLIMGQLLALGRSEMTLSDIQDSLQPTNNKPMRFNAPGSGLILQDIE
ncbi:MAG: tRNA pseudouridine(38-40) synthase TruA, partial [Crocinitomicaceae bacterium]